MSFRVLVVALFSFTLVLWSCSDDKKKDTPDAGEDSGPDTDTDADVAPYDFEAQAPWYLCPEEEFPEGATIVTAFDQTYQYFGDEDRRTVESIVDFPEPADWAQVGMWFNLECPESGLCDHWDRAGSVDIDGSLLVACNDNKGLHVLNVRNPEAPQVIASDPLGGTERMAP